MDQEQMDQLIDKFAKEEEKVRIIGTYYPSEIGYCLRRIYFQYKFPKPLDAKTLRIFLMGRIVHELITKVLDSAGFDTHLNERSVCLIDRYEKFVLSGRLDDFIVGIKDGKKWVIEVKSANSVKKYDKPTEYHCIQIAPYIKAINADGGFVLYVDKNTLEVKMFKIEDWEHYLDIAMARAHRLHKALTTGTLPYKEAVKFNPWQCNYCHYKKECDELGEGKEI